MIKRARIIDSDLKIKTIRQLRRKASAILCTCAADEPTTRRMKLKTLSGLEILTPINLVS